MGWSACVLPPYSSPHQWDNGWVRITTNTFTVLRDPPNPPLIREVAQPDESTCFQQL